MRNSFCRYRSSSLPRFLPFFGAVLFLSAGSPAHARTGEGAVSIRPAFEEMRPGGTAIGAPQYDTEERELSCPAEVLREGVKGTVKLKMTGKIRKSEALENGGDRRLPHASVQEGIRGAILAPETVDWVAREMAIIADARFFIGSGKGMYEVVPDVQYPTYSMAELRRFLVYPEIARQNGIEGSVTVSAQIDTNGQLLRVVIRSCTNKIFESPAKEAVGKLTFTPGLQDGKPAKMWVTFNVDFRLEDPVPDSTAKETVPEKTEKKDGVEEYGMDDYVEGATSPTYGLNELRTLIRYPMEARENDIEGRVVISARIDTNGRVLEAVVRTATHEIFEEEALKAVRALKFTPGVKDGKPIRMWVTLTIDYQLAD